MSQTLKEKLLENGHDDLVVRRFLQHKAEKATGKYAIHVRDDDAYSMFSKVAALGLDFDGVNAVITGRTMFMITYHGYKNKVLETYPEAKFDIQLVREGDEFSISKDSGKIEYDHKINNPFEDKQIVGAYCIIKTDRGEYFESLNPTDFEKMSEGSKQSHLWKKWSSEFWLKSVIKRACKRHFNDIVAEIDKVDNDDFGIDEEKQLKEEQQVEIDQTITKLKAAKTLEELKQTFVDSGKLVREEQVVAVKDEMKAKLSDSGKENEDESR